MEEIFMAINVPIKKRDFKKLIETTNRNHKRISGWCVTYDDFKEFILQKEKSKTIYNDTEVSNNNKSNHNR